jgi:hypothetical protein
MLTPPNYCIQVALSINRATCCFDTSHSRYPARRVWGSVVYFWRKARTNESRCCSNGRVRFSGARRQSDDVCQRLPVSRVRTVSAPADVGGIRF